MFKGMKKYIVSVSILILLYVLGLRHAGTRLTYLEYTTVNERNDASITLAANNAELKQEFVMPYDIFSLVSLQIGTYSRDNNSTWKFSLMDSSGKVLYENEFNASGISDGTYYRHKLDKKIRVNKGDTYSFSITAKDVSEISSLAFYASAGNNAENTALRHNGELVDNTLCFKIYGGDRDYWWHGLTTFLFIYILVIILRFYRDGKKGRSIKEDKFLQGLILGALVFVLLSSFAVNSAFTDENDNVRGGMVIANGGVLYRDYVVQHTPVAYYLCAVFAVLGAGSIEQFRLSYYIFEALLWVFLYIRHKDYYGEKKMVILPVLETICISSVVAPYGFQILSDGFEGLMFTVLMLEFLRYHKDRKLTWDRSIIVSACIWDSFGAAFVSAYALVFLAVIFLGLEVSWLVKNKISLKESIKRYYKLFVALIVPFAAAVVYFKVNHALRIAFDQFYTFNRVVYPKYTEGLGYRISQPFINAVQHFFSVIADNFNAVVTATATNVVILQLVLMGLATGIIVALFEKKQFVPGASLGLMMVFSATRGYGFHGIAAWYLAVLIVVLYTDLLADKMKKIGKPLLGVFAVILASTFFVTVGKNLLYEQPSISELESRVVELTEQEEDKDIFIDAYGYDTLYLFYKGRRPVNPAVYMLPWYMDWYEKWNVDALLSRSPKIVVYNIERATWGLTHYTYYFDAVLNSNYTRLGDEGWRFFVWVRTE